MTKSELFKLIKLSVDTLENAFAEQPEIVRCKDCKYYKTYECSCDGCGLHDGDWYCADGEMKE